MLVLPEALFDEFHETLPLFGTEHVPRLAHIFEGRKLHPHLEVRDLGEEPVALRNVDLRLL
jgi:hypothetical protein